MRARSSVFAVAGLLFVSVVAAACWNTKPNPRFCDATTACTSAELPYCNVAANECEASPPDGPLVDLSGDATDATPACTMNAQCMSLAQPVCDSQSHACRACQPGTPSADCAAFAGKPACAASGACVECTSNADCAAQGKTCDTAANKCIPCQQNSDCTSGACRADHVCAAASDIVYVDNKDGACTGTTHAGTTADPHCQVAQALAATGSTVLVAGSTTSYDAIDVTTALSKAIVGPGRGSAKAAQFATPSKSGVIVHPTIGTTTLTLAGVILSGSAIGTKASGAACVQVPGSTVSLTITRSRITDSGLHAVNSDCTLTLDANEITTNAGGGINIAGGTYAISNNLVFGNGNVTTATVPGFVTNAAASGTFSFNTVAKNQVAAGVGGIDCSALSHALSSSIVFGNTTSGTSQFAGTCALSDVVTGSTETASGATKLDPVFVSTSDFRLDVSSGKAANDACCIDKLSSGSSDHDVDGKRRPIRPSFDIGAFEAP